MVRRLYKIWAIVSGVTHAPGVPYVRYDRSAGTWSYPLVEAISALPTRWERSDMVSTDRERVDNFCSYLNEMADDNDRYEVRAESPPD